MIGFPPGHDRVPTRSRFSTQCSTALTRSVTILPHISRIVLFSNFSSYQSKRRMFVLIVLLIVLGLVLVRVPVLVLVFVLVLLLVGDGGDDGGDDCGGHQEFF